MNEHNTMLHLLYLYCSSNTFNVWAIAIHCESETAESSSDGHGVTTNICPDIDHIQERVANEDAQEKCDILFFPDASQLQL